MSNKTYYPPVRPPRGSKVSKDTSGRLMNIIAELSVSKNNDDRLGKMSDLKKDFEASDARLIHLISGKREHLSITMETFSQISAKINTSRRGCRDVKEKLVACKKLLQCKRDEIRRLWLENIEHNEVIATLKEIEELSKVNERVEKFLQEEKFLKATQLLVSSTALLEGKLCSAEALKDLSNELTTLKKKLWDVLVFEMLHKYLYKSPKEVFLRKVDHEELPSYEDIFGQNLKEVTFKLPTEGCQLDFKNTNYESIAEILHCISLLNAIPETVEVLKQNAAQELSSIVSNSSEVLCAILSNSTYPHSSQNGNEPRHLLDLLEVIIRQFKYVAVNHYAFLDNLERISMTNNLKDVPLEIADIYSKIQTAMQKFISEYLDLHNFAGAQRATAAFDKVPPSTTNISSFFLRKGIARNKKNCLFKFDASSHALSKKTYLLEQKGANDSTESERSFLVCSPNAKNITIVYKTLKVFITEMETALKMEYGSHCPLHSFVNDCVKIFLDQVSIDVNRVMDRTTNSLEAWQPVTNIEELKSVDAKTQILSSTLALNSTLVEMESLISALPDYAPHFLQIIIHVLTFYKEQCNSAYKSLIPYADTEEQRIFSVAWSRDDDISRLLRSLPNWTNLKIKSSDSTGDLFEESPEETRFRNKCESELLIRNLSAKDSIFLSDIMSDYSKLENLSLMHESMEWFSSKVLSFAERLPDIETSMLSLMPDKFSEENDGNIEFAVGMSTKATLKKLSKDFEDIADTCVLVLHLEVRAHCFYHLFQLSKQGSYINRKDDEEPEPEVVKLNLDLTKIDEALSPVLQPKKIRYVFEGLGELLSTILIKSVSDIKKINENGVKKMGRNIFAIQQNLAGITMTREVALDRARQYFDLLNHSYEDILNQIVEEGPLFQEHEYSAVIQLLHKSREGVYSQDSLTSYLEKLRQILDEVAVSV